MDTIFLPLNISTSKASSLFSKYILCYVQVTMNYICIVFD